jgi:hypothetical protein
MKRGTLFGWFFQVVVIAVGIAVSPSIATARIDGVDVLGSRWHLTEGDWQSTWVRRGNTPVFDGTWKHPNGSRVTATVTVGLTGTAVRAERRNSSDGNNCNYQGTLASDQRSMSGTFTCMRVPGTFNWRGRIEYGGR